MKKTIGSTMPLQSGVLAGEQFLTLPELQERGRRAAAFFAMQGVQTGDGVAILLPNSVPFLEATIGAQHIGAYPIPLNWHLAAPEARYILEDSGARILIANRDLLEAAGSLPAHVIAVTIDGGERMTWDAILGGHAPITSAPASSVQSMVYTSGTTGRPKGIRRAPPKTEELEGMLRIRRRIYDTRPGMRALLPAPMYHSAPNFFALNVVRNDGLLILPPRFDAEELLRDIERHRLTHLFLVPTMLVRLLALPPEVRARYDVSSLQAVLHAGAACPAHVKSAMIDWWGPVINEYYGSTEMGALTFCDSRDSMARPGTVGRPLEGIALTIRDEQRHICSTGIQGEIYVSATVQPDFTYHGADEKRAGVEHGGELATGDVGYLDADGYLFICDRRTDMIISGGVNIYPAEIEAALMAIPGVRDCAVFGIPDAEFGESVTAVIHPEASTTLTQAEIAGALRLVVAGYKIPRRIVFQDKMPRDENGKLFKRLLRDQFMGSGCDHNNG